MDTTVGLFMEAGRLVRRRIETAHAPLSFTQCEALRHVAEGGEMTMHELAQALGIAAPSATALVSELVREQYLRRAGNPRDRRQVLLVPTMHGQRAVATTLKSRTRVLEQLLCGLSGRDHRDLQRIFTKMTDSIN